jgi:hypothetical protein
MANREISDEEYFYLQGRKQVADLVEPVWNHPQTAEPARRLMKTVYPDLPIPDFDSKNEVRQMLAADRKERSDREEADRKKKEKDEWDAERDRVQKEFGFTEDGMKKLEDFMIEKRIASYEAAAHYHAAKNPKPSDPTQDMQDRYWGHFNDKSDEAKVIFADPEAWGRKELLKTLNKMQAGAR